MATLFGILRQNGFTLPMNLSLGGGIGIYHLPKTECLINQSTNVNN
jgi:hypothetical protein